MKKLNLTTVLKFRGPKGKNIPEFINNVHMHNGMLYCTDNRNFCGIKVDFEIDGAASINSEEFKKINGRGDISSITIKNNGANIKLGEKSFTVFADEEMVVKLPEHNVISESVLEIDKEFLSLKSFCGDDDLRPAMTGVFYDASCNQFAATDAHKMKWIKTDFNHSNGITLDKLILSIPVGSYKALVLDRHLYLEKDNFFAYISIIDERYPDYKAVIPTHSVWDITMSKKELKDILEDAEICADNSTKLIEMVYFNETLVFSSADIYLGKKYRSKNTFCVSNNSDDLNIGLNIKFINQIISSIDNEEITLSISSPNRAVVINSNSLTMPVTLNN